MKIALLRGTAAVVIRAHNRTVVAADSKVIRTDDPAWAGIITKIHLVNDTVFVCAGFRKEERLGYDLIRIATDSIMQGGTVEEQMVRFAITSADQLGQALNEFKRLQPEPFHTHFGVRRPLAAQAVFVDRGGEISVRQFEVRSLDAEAGVIVHPSVITCPRGSAVFLGEDAAMYSLGNALGASLTGDPIASARSLIESAIRSRPDLVGPPIKIVEVRNREVSWV